LVFTSTAVRDDDDEGEEDAETVELATASYVFEPVVDEEAGVCLCVQAALE
jgi:hypothetical protein